MNLPDSNPWYRAIYAIVFGVLILLILYSFFQSFKLKRNREVHLTIYALLFVNVFCDFVAQISQAIYDTEEHIIPFDPRFLYFKIFTFSAQNGVDVYVFFMWIELYNTVQYGNFAKLEQISRRCTVLRTISVVFILLLSSIVQLVPSVISGKSGKWVWITLVAVALYIVPIFIVVIIRWKTLYLLLRECLRSSTRNGDRFIDVTKVTVICIVTYIFSNVIIGLVESGITTNVVLSVFLSFLPNSAFAFGVWYYFIPNTKKQYQEDAKLHKDNTSGESPQNSEPNSSRSSITQSTSIIDIE